VALLGGLASAARAETVAEFQRGQTPQKFQQEMQVRQSPQIDKAHPSLPGSDLFSIHLEHGMLILRTPLPDIPPFRKVKIGSADDWTLISVNGGAPPNGKPVIPAFFLLTQSTYTPTQTETLLLQQMPGNVFIISLQDQTPTGNKTVQLQEQFPNRPVNIPGGGCQLTMMEFVPGRPVVPIVWNAANFAALTLEHPAEVDRYLRPLLHKLDQDAALVPDPMLAFELFSDQWTTDSATTAKVHSLIPGLAGGDFHSRTRVENELAALGKDAALALIHVDRSKLSPEQNARIDKVLLPYRPISTQEAAKLRAAPGFLANYLYSDDVVIRKAAFAQLLSVTKLPLVFDPAADPTARTAAIAALFKQLAAAKVTGN
jgi:hypothetical protein